MLLHTYAKYRFFHFPNEKLVFFLSTTPFYRTYSNRIGAYFLTGRYSHFGVQSGNFVIQIYIL